MTSKEKMKKEALHRIQLLIEYVNLNPNVYPYFEQNQLYYSYLTAGGLIGSIDTISYNPEYEKMVRDFEERYGCMVYHCIESCIASKCLIMLFIEKEEEDWEFSRPQEDGSVMACVYDLDEDYSEMGYIGVDGYQGALVRTW